MRIEALQYGASQPPYVPGMSNNVVLYLIQNEKIPRVTLKDRTDELYPNLDVSC